MTTTLPLFRQSFADETARAASICQPLTARPGDGAPRCFVAVRERPVERLVAAAFWCETSADTASFTWQAINSILGSKIEQDFLKALVQHLRDRSPHIARIQHASWISALSSSAKILEAAGWGITGTRHYFTADPAAWRSLLEDVALSADFQIISLLPSYVPEITEFIQKEAIGVEAADIALGFQTAWGQAPTLFDPRCSFLVQAAGGMVGICLANLRGSRLELEVFSAPPEIAKPMLRHCLQSAEAITMISEISRHQDAEISAPTPLSDLTMAVAGKCFRFTRPLSTAITADEEQEH